MPQNPRFRDLALGPGLIVAVIATLGAAGLLVVAGLTWELVQLDTTVVTEAPAPPVRQLSAAAPAQAAPSEPVALAALPDALADVEPDEADTPADPTSPAASQDAPETAPPVPVAEATPASTPATLAARRQPDPATRGAPRASADLPIVMFHHVGRLPSNPDIFRRDLTVSPELFEDELQYLTDKGIQTVSLDDLMEHYAGGPALPQRSVILTFDDGYDDNYEYAFPLLKQYGMVGTFFIVTEFVGRPGYLTWDQIKEMDAAGMSIEAHSATHADLSVVRGAELQRQMVQPKQDLEEALGHPVRFMAYPSGKYNPATIAAAKAAGYVAAVTVVHGTIHPASAPFEMTRVRARGADTAAALAARMTPASWRR